MDNGSLTSTQQAMLSVLADGRPHRRGELHACLPDELGAMSNVQPHLTAIRKVLRPRGQEIICEWYKRGYAYRWVHLLASTVDGKQ